MRGFRVLIDFLNFAFFLGLVIFIILYIVVGDRIDIFTKIAKMLIPVSYFMAMFLLALRSDEEKFEKFRKEDKLDEIVKYLDRVDSVKDIVVIIILSVVIVFLGMIEGINSIDIVQALTCLVILNLWHVIIFRKKEDLAGLQYMTNFDVMKDRVVIFLLPLIVLAIPFSSSGGVETVDIIQAIVSLAIMYGWRKLMLKKDE